MPNTYEIQSGYAYEFDGKRNWKTSSSERWQTVVYTPKEGDTFVGLGRIDDGDVAVFRCTDGRFRAQSRVMTQR